jgi:RNA polymerase sigma factor (sigma-70 family)
MILNSMISDVSRTDSELVGASLSGNCDAFGQIVARYQSLVCSLAYSATGSLSQSEDLAQDTFVTAWKQLSQLREREKLRSWLCGIARNLINNWLRKQGREPSHHAEPLEEVSESRSPEPLPIEQAISREEEALLWHSLERIPEIYREPLVLFYREHQSVETVAANLELSEDAARQRLSRGRKLLQEQVLAFVEGALQRTNPGQAFTLGVMSVLPAMTISAKAAMLGAAAAKGSLAAKCAGLMGLLGSLLSPIMGFFTIWLGYRTTMETARSDRERQYTRGFYRQLVGCIAVFFVLYFALICCGPWLIKTNNWLFVSLVIGLAVAYIMTIAGFSVQGYHSRKKLLASLTPEEIATRPTQPVWEYRSRFSLFGLPFIHIRFGDRLGEPIKAWIAVGDCAFGVLFAFGGLAIAPVSIGGCAVGLFSFGGLALGALVLGGMGFGVWVFGGLAIGWQAFGGCAIALNAAWGGYAIAHDFALGGLAHALQANNDIATQVMMANPFFKISDKVLPYLFWLNLVWFIPVVVQMKVIRRLARKNAQRQNV